tara:strand:- start:1318 stop:1842 length:525 start_codon:yes stop_codon:yes gene_type:complete
MAQEFTIKSASIEDKINQLLPSQGGAGAGIDFSASTMVIPIVDLTETAEGSALRQDLQSAFTHANSTPFEVTNTTSTIVTTTGFWRIVGVSYLLFNNADIKSEVFINDGATSKRVWGHRTRNGVTAEGDSTATLDLIVKTEAGDSIIVSSSSVNGQFMGQARQIADVNGNLINP